MANKRISELTTITGANLADADLLVVVDVSDTTMASSGTNKKITMAELAKDSALTDNLIAKSTLTTDGDVLTRAAGAPARITRADLADDSAFSSRYVAKTDDAIWVGVLDMDPYASPTLTEINSYVPVFQLDDSSERGGAFSMPLPSWWNTFHIDLYWTNMGANSGNVRWYMATSEFADGETVGGGSTFLASSAIAAPAQSVLKVSRIHSSKAYTSGDMFSLLTLRTGQDAGDTLVGNAGLIGVLLTRAS